MQSSHGHCEWNDFDSSRIFIKTDTYFRFMKIGMKKELGMKRAKNKQFIFII